MTLFVMEKELRVLKGRGNFPLPPITPQGTRIENIHQLRKTLWTVDEEVVQILATIRESESNFEKEKEEARFREQQSKTARHTYIPPNSRTQSRMQVQQPFSQQEIKTDIQKEAYTSNQT